MDPHCSHGGNLQRACLPVFFFGVRQHDATKFAGSNILEPRRWALGSDTLYQSSQICHAKSDKLSSDKLPLYCSTTMSTSTDVAWSSDMDPQHPSLERNDEVPDSTLLQKSPNQDPQKPQLPQPKASIWRRIQPIWPLEILAILAAIGLLMAVIIVLSKFHDREITEWSFFINLSTFVTILATLLRISILYAVAEIISQLKWIWFTQYTRPVIHLHDFDQASRGFLGSLFLWKMLARQKPSSPGIAAAAAAFVVVVSFALGSFAQQSLSTGPCEGIAVDLSSSIPVANYVRGNYYRIGAGLWELAVDMRSAMVQGLTKPGKSRSDCPSRLSQRELYISRFWDRDYTRLHWPMQQMCRPVGGRRRSG